jgi:hypothetical protein
MLICLLTGFEDKNENLFLLEWTYLLYTLDTLQFTPMLGCSKEHFHYLGGGLNAAVNANES